MKIAYCSSIERDGRPLVLVPVVVSIILSLLIAPSDSSWISAHRKYSMYKKFDVESGNFI